MADEDNIIALDAGTPTVFSVKRGVRQFVFQPSGTASNGVYTSWSDLYTDLVASTAPVREVIIDDSALGAFPAAATIPSGTYDLAGVKIIGVPSTRVGVQQWATLALASGCIIDDCAGLENIAILSHPAGGGEFRFDSDNSPNADIFILKRCFIQSASGANLIDISGTPGNGTFLKIILDNTDFGNGNNLVTLDSNSTVGPVLLRGSIVSKDVFTGPAGSSIADLEVEAGSLYNPEQNLFSGTKPTGVDSTIRVQYDPSTPANWTTPPTTVLSALDDLASITAGTGGGSAIGGSTGGTDNAVLRADGVGGSTLQSSGVTIDDSDNLNVPGTVTITVREAISLNSSFTSDPTTSTRISFDTGTDTLIACVDDGGDPEIHYMSDGGGHFFHTLGGGSPTALQIKGATTTINDTLIVSGYTEMKGGRKIGRTAVDHTVAHSLDHTTDGILGCNTTTGAVTINLFDPALISPSSEVDGYMVTIKDEAGNASSNNITINGAAGYTIDGNTSITISINYASVTLYSDGANWFVI